MIDEFQVKNFKALRDVKLDLTPLHVLIGPNNSGKTSMLEALATVGGVNPKTPPLTMFGQGPPGALLWDPAVDGMINISCRVRDEEGVLAFRASVDPATGALKALQAQSGGPVDPLIHQRLLAAIKRPTLVRWSPRMLRLPVMLDVAHPFEIDPYGFGLAPCLDDILGESRERFAQLEDRFRQIFPDVQSIALVVQAAYARPQAHQPTALPGLQNVSGKGILFVLKNGRRIPAAQASDGMLLILAFLALAHAPEPPALLLVEEPENGVHPERLREIFDILTQLTTGDRTQVVITSHSPYLLDRFKPEQVTLCHRLADGSVGVTRLSTVGEVQRQLKVFSLGEIWTAEGDENLAAGAKPTCQLLRETTGGVEGLRWA